MEVEECTDTKMTTVKFYSKHCGHELGDSNLKHTRICRSDKDKIACKYILQPHLYVLYILLIEI